MSAEVQTTQRRTLASRYVVHDRVTTRGPSSLYRGIHVESGRVVAVREFTPLRSTEETVSALTRVAGVSSRFLAEVTDVVAIDEGVVCVAHTWFEGESLAQRIARKSALPPEEAAALVLRVAHGVAALHKAQLAHGNLRPTRIFHEKAKRGWHLKLLGAGVFSVPLATAVASAELARYLPPECLDGAEPALAADVWGLATLLLECLAGAPAYGGDDAVQVRAAVREGRALALRETFPDAPDELLTLLRESSAADPAARPSVGDFSARLQELFPEPEAGTSSRTARSAWTRGRFLGKRVPVAVEAQHTSAGTATVVTPRQKRAVRRASVSAVVLTVSALAPIMAFLYVRGQRSGQQRARALVTVATVTAEPSVLERLAPTASAVPTASGDPAAERASAEPLAAGTVAPTATPRVPERAPRVASSAPSLAAGGNAAPSTERGVLDLRSASPCTLMIDGEDRGLSSGTRSTLAPGMHQVTCVSSEHTHRLTLRIAAGRVTRVVLTDTGEALIDAPSRGE